VQFDFDPGKDAINLSKHGFSLAAAAQLSSAQLGCGACLD